MGPPRGDRRSLPMDNTSAPGPVSDATSTRTAFDRLDTLVQVTTVHGWIYLAALFAVGAGSIAFAVLYEVPTKVHGEGILLIKQDTLVQIRAKATGRLLDLKVRPGDWVRQDQPIGRIAEDELEDRIRQAEARLDDLEREDRELTQFEGAEQRSKDAATREKLYDARDAPNKGKSRLAELRLDQVTAENARSRARLERRLKMDELKTRLRLDRDKLKRTSPVVSPAEGQVAQMLSVPGGLVQEGAPVALLHTSRSEAGTDESGPPYDAIAFVSAGEGKKIDIDDDVEVVPATVKREEHGFIRGRVVAISELPATKLAMEAALQHPELVEAFLKRYAPGVVLRVQIQLKRRESATQEDARDAGGRQPPFQWSSFVESPPPLKTGTICQAAIVVERRPLIRLILPWARKLVGTGG
jgi:HlyD family secretion protein